MNIEIKININLIYNKIKSNKILKYIKLIKNNNKISNKIISIFSNRANKKIKIRNFIQYLVTINNLKKIN